MIRMISTVFGAAVILLAAAACNDDDKAKNANPVDGEPQSQMGRQAQEERNLKTTTIEVFDDRVNPRQVEVMGSEPVQLEVTNRGSAACTFFFGTFLTGLQVPPGQTAKQSLTLEPAGSREPVKMGCAGDTKRQGDAIVQFRGVAPGSGR